MERWVALFSWPSSTFVHGLHKMCLFFLQVHVSLVNGRPGASGPSRTLVDFTQARFIRMRLQRLRMLPQDQHTRYEFLHKLRLRQYFYSLRDIAIGGQCPCNGHASECPVDYSTMV